MPRAPQPKPAKALGSWLQGLRRRRGVSAVALASTLGIHPDNLRRIEQGKAAGSQFLFPYLAWLAEDADTRAELERDLARYCVEAGKSMRMHATTSRARRPAPGMARRAAGRG